MNSIASFVGLLWFWSELGMGGMMGWGGRSEVGGWGPGALSMVKKYPSHPMSHTPDLGKVHKYFGRGGWKIFQKGHQNFFDPPQNCSKLF